MTCLQSYRVYDLINAWKYIEVWGRTIVSATRTDRICPRDFAVGLKIPGRDEFYPTRIRLLFDLYLKRLSNFQFYRSDSSVLL